MFKLNDKVLIKSENIIGTIVDIDNTYSKVKYIVESDTEGEIEGRPGGIWPLYDCFDGDIERV